ncbi:MAG: phosphate-starvation-inducible PsiE family protein [Candidatus Thermoplasmatota archaeon]|nr:phosphate-starvation-inducible PsiE family protein [Candidatus Thermoplasmatota archaeon]
MAKQLDIRFIDIVSLLLRILLLAAFAAVMLHMFIGIYYSVLAAINSPASIETYIYSFIDVIVEDSLLAVVIFEIYESIVDFFRGEGDTIIYIINAAISFTAREIILTIFAAHIFNIVNAYEVISFSILILALAVSRYLLILSGASKKSQ